MLSTTAMFIPLMSHMMTVFTCQSTWLSSGWQCYSGLHLLLVFIVAMIAALFAAFSLIGTRALAPVAALKLAAACCEMLCVCSHAVVASFFDRDPGSESITARPHGRVEITMIAIKLALILVFSIGASIPVLITLLIVLASGALFLYIYFMYLPYYLQRMNCFQVAFASTFLWCAACALIAYLRGVPEHNVEAFTCLLGAPGAAFAGYQFAKARFESFDGPVELKNAYMVRACPACLVVWLSGCLVVWLLCTMCTRAGGVEVSPHVGCYRHRRH